MKRQVKPAAHTLLPLCIDSENEILNLPTHAYFWNHQSNQTWSFYHWIWLHCPDGIGYWVTLLWTQQHHSVYVDGVGTLI